ncbi:MAG: MFS transporter [Erysipelotrichaceae bacterium]|nr:MFS transporter [Erysipelotrichaceae bacterium]
MEKKFSMRYILVMIATCGLIASSVGLQTNISGLFFNPIAESFGIMKGAVSMTLTISNLIFALGGMIAPRLIKEQNLKLMVIAGTAIEAGGTILLSMAPNIMFMYILNAIRGFAAGVLGFVIVTIIISNWFKESVGLMTSIALGFSGVAAAIFSPIISSVIAGGGWRVGYLVAGILIVVFNLPAVFFLPALHPHTKGFKAFGEKEIIEPHPTGFTEEKPGRKISIFLMILACLYAVMACGAGAMPQHFPGIADSFGFGAVGATLISVTMVANTGGKIILGILSDKLGSRLSIIFYLCLAIAGTFIFLTIHTSFFMIVAAVLFGMVYALGAVGPVMISKDMFGLENYSKTYPTVNMCGTVSNAIFSTVIGYLYDFSGNYYSTLFLMLGMLSIGIVVVIVAYTRNDAMLAKQ